MCWFEIFNDCLYSKCSNPWDHLNGALWGRHLGGKWCIDYYFKMCFDLSEDEWNDVSHNIKSNKDFFNLCDKLGIYYEYNGEIIRRGKIYNYRGEEIGTIDRRK